MSEPEDNAKAEIESKFDRGFLLDALADLEAKSDRRYESLARRLTRLEERGRGNSFMEADTEKIVIGAMLFYVGVMVAPEILRLVKAWRESS